jgi:hypothetical protein
MQQFASNASGQCQHAPAADAVQHMFCPQTLQASKAKFKQKPATLLWRYAAHAQLRTEVGTGLGSTAAVKLAWMQKVQWLA